MNTTVTPADSLLSVTEVKQLQTQTLTSAGTLTGAETIPAVRSTALFQTTSAALAQFTLKPIAAATNTAAAALTGTEVFPLSQSGGLVQSTLLTIAQYVMAQFAPQRQSVPVTTAGQTSYATTGYTVPLVNVYIAGSRLNPSQYQALDGVHIVITDANVIASLVPGMTVDIDALESIAVAGVATPAQVALYDPANNPAIGAIGGTEVVLTRQGAGLFQTTFNKLSAFVLSQLGAGTATSAAALTGSEVFPFSQAGALVQSTLTTIGNWVVNTYQGFTQSGTGAVSRTVAGKVGERVSVKDFGATGNGVTDDTAAVQAFFNYIVANQRTGYMPIGTYLLSSAINIPMSNGWGVIGESWLSTVLMQSTSNVPILNFGSSGSTTAYGVHMSDLCFNYSTTQPVANTSANCITFQTGGWFHLTWERLNFIGGYYGINCGNSQGGPWGSYWNDLVFGGTLSGGAMNWTGATNGVPNNVWGRMTFNCGSMAGPVLNNIRGYNFKVGALEFLSANNGPQLILTAAGSNWDVDTMKLEVYSYTASQNLFQLSNGTSFRLGSFTIAGSVPSVMNPASGSVVYLFVLSNPGYADLEIGRLDLVAPSTLPTAGGSVYVFGGGGGSAIGGTGQGTGRIRVRSMYLYSGYSWQLQNYGGSTTSIGLIIDTYKNDIMSNVDNGDANYTATLGDPNIIRFETALTAPRTIALDSVGNNLFAGMYREFRIKGAINGSNTITVSCSGVTLATLTADCVIRFTWSRIDAAHIWNCWKITNYVTGLPA
jgi:hypothetical protein